VTLCIASFAVGSVDARRPRGKPVAANAKDVDIEGARVLYQSPEMTWRVAQVWELAGARRDYVKASLLWSSHPNDGLEDEALLTSGKRFKIKGKTRVVILPPIKHGRRIPNDDEMDAAKDVWYDDNNDDEEEEGSDKKKKAAL